MSTAIEFFDEKPPLACDLTAIDAGSRDGHLSTIRQLFETVQDVRELDDGYALRLPGDTDTFLRAADFIANERKCCAFFRFVLDVEPSNGPLWLSLTGPEGVKEFLHSELGDQVGIKFPS